MLLSLPRPAWGAQSAPAFLSAFDMGMLRVLDASNRRREYSLFRFVWRYQGSVSGLLPVG